MCQWLHVDGRFLSRSCPVSHESRAVALCLVDADGRGLLPVRPAHASDTIRWPSQARRMLAFSTSGERGGMRRSSRGRGTSPRRGRTCSTSTYSCRSRAPRTGALFSAKAEPRILRVPLRGQLRGLGGRARKRRRDLPIGVVKDTRGEGHTPLEKHAKDLTKDYVGLTCAACHTGDLKYNGERFLIHAGQSNLDYERFISDLNAAVSKAVQDPKGTGYLERMAAKGVDDEERHESPGRGQAADGRLARTRAGARGSGGRARPPRRRRPHPERSVRPPVRRPERRRATLRSGRKRPRQHQAHSGAGERASGVERGAACSACRRTV